jgi:hypothetical protein
LDIAQSLAVPASVQEAKRHVGMTMRTRHVGMTMHTRHVGMTMHTRHVGMTMHTRHVGMTMHTTYSHEAHVTSHMCHVSRLTWGSARYPQEENYFFRLSKYQGALEKLYADRPDFVQVRAPSAFVFLYFGRVLSSIDTWLCVHTWHVTM